jgi:molecular chaperone HtpG
VGSVTKFDDKPLQSVARGEVDLDSEEEKTVHEAKREQQEIEFADLLDWLKETLSEHVKEVRLSPRLIESPGLPDHRRFRHHTGARAPLPGFRAGHSGQ